ncbi:uncharacterized protein LOC141601517 [Silene latifolia]|uniref:uncharacterized protein LOC141601517 n=1 Tax=Silene latifolia TaxID=37657 RepID=UPI003D780959
MRMNKQGGPAGARGTGSAGPFTFIEALNKLATPKGSVGQSGKDLPSLEFLLTMIYAHNDVSERQVLWSVFKNVAGSCSLPWLWLGDFNTILSPVERLGGNSTEVEMEQFQDCVSICCMEDVQATRALFTWKSGLQGKKCFKYFNMWGQSEMFKVSVNDVWQRQIRGTKMFQVIKKLKALKPVLKNLNKSCFSDIENSYNITVVLLEHIQKDMVNNPGNTDLMQQEHDVAQELKELLVARDSFFGSKG